MDKRLSDDPYLNEQFKQIKKLGNPLNGNFIWVYTEEDFFRFYGKKAVTIQRCFRGYQARKFMDIQANAAVTIQQFCISVVFAQSEIVHGEVLRRFSGTLEGINHVNLWIFRPMPQ